MGGDRSGPDTSASIGFGEDAHFVLKNPALRLILLAAPIGALGVVVFWIPDKSGRGAFMHILIAPLLILIAAVVAFRGFRLVGSPNGRAVVTSRSLLLTLPGGHDEQEIPLESIERIWQTQQRGVRTSVTIERSDGLKHFVAASNLDATDEARLVALVLRRAELRRAGVSKRDELAAAEAYLAAVSVGQRPFGVVVRKAANEKFDIELVASRSDVPEDVGGGRLFIPSDVLAALKAAGGTPKNARKLRGTQR